MYNKGQDVGYNDSYNQGLFEGHDNDWNEAKQYYQRIFGKQLTDAMQKWNEERNEYDDSIEESSEEHRDSTIDEDDEWTFHGKKEDSKQTESRKWF